MVKEYNPTIDALKGFLILFVIIGHALPGSLNGSFPRYAIYAFHMPLFLFLSGYLINIESLTHKSIEGVFRKYWKRMLCQWILAWMVYTAIVLWPDYNLHNLMVRLYLPYYHLWYVPDLFFMILPLWLFMKYIGSTFVVYVALFSIYFLFLEGNYFIRVMNPFHLSLFAVFIVGVLSQSYDSKSIRHKAIFLGGAVLSIFIVSLFVVFFQFDNPFDMWAKYFQVPICCLICCFIVRPIIEFKIIRNPFLEFIGRKSLPIYLWHVLPIMTIEYYFEKCYYVGVFLLFTLSYVIARYYAKKEMAIVK